MIIACGIACLLLGLVGLIGQLISTIDFPRAQRLGLQEGPLHTDALFRRLELNTARWDLAVIWIVPLAGLLMLLGHTWWPYVALVAGGVLVDTGGREIAKVLGLSAEGVRVGTEREHRLVLAYLGSLAATGLWAVLAAMTFLLGRAGVS